MRNTKVKNIFFFLLFCMVLMTGCGELEKLTDTLTLEDIKAGALENGWLAEEPGESFEVDWHSTFAYERLSDTEKIWYEDINRMLAVRSENGVKLSEEGFDRGLTQKDIDKIYNCVMIDHPEYFYVEGYEYTQYSRQDKLLGVTIVGKYGISSEECKTRKEQIEAAAEEITAQVPVEATDYEKLQFVYEYLILHTEYDLNAADNQNIYSVFLGGASVCQGYAKAAQYLLNKLGVECTIVFGLVDETESHSWNLVKSGEQYYYMDATWGDASYISNGQEMEQEEVPDINYDYLCITTEQITKTHTIIHEIALPECTSIEDNYYVREGCYIYAYDAEQIAREFEEAFSAGKKSVTLKCHTYEIYEILYNELVTKQGIFDYLIEELNQVQFIADQEKMSLTFWVTK